LGFTEKIKQALKGKRIDLNLVQLETRSFPSSFSYMPKALSPLPSERDFESFSGSPLPLGEGLGVRAKTIVLNMDLV